MTTNSTQPSLSLVILCYRSGEFARTFTERTVEALAAAGIDSYELILVGNYVEGSEDPTPAVVEGLAEEDPRVRCSARPKEGWMGWDMRSGLELARGDFIGVIDGDGQMPVDDVPVLYDLIRKQGSGLVKTYRITRGDSASRRLISGVFNRLFRLLFPGVVSKDINSKPKLMTREFYDRTELLSDDWFIDAEIVLEARRQGVEIQEIPTHFVGLTGRRSFIGPKAVLEFVWNLLRYRVRESRRPRVGT